MKNHLAAHVSYIGTQYKTFGAGKVSCLKFRRKLSLFNYQIWDMSIKLRMLELFCICVWLEANMAGDENVNLHNANSRASSNNTYLIGLLSTLNKIMELR
jgi:hypothetical protein